MSAIHPIDQARRLYQAAEDSIADPAPYYDQAREELIEKLIEGKTVNRMTSRDIFDCAADNSSVPLFDLLENVLGMNREHGDGFRLAGWDCANAAKKIIEDFVDSKPEWIWERACEIANYDSEEGE